jgi:predicted deacetylase
VFTPLFVSIARPRSTARSHGVPVSAQFLIRLDDACSTLNRRKWALLEAVLDRHLVKPIVAVVPENHDPSLVFDERDSGFWEKVRSWQAKGWGVAMHGHTHVMHPIAQPGLVPFYSRSEFAGLDLQAQRNKIREAWQCFQAEGVTPQIWVGPAHSFDRQTLVALREETPIRVVSDGIAFDTYFEHDFHWIPQQMWGLRDRSAGLWTVCLHPNDMSEAAIETLGEVIGTSFRGRMISAADVHLTTRRKSVLGVIYHRYFWWRWNRRAAAEGDL